MPSDEGRFWQSELNKGQAILALWINPCISRPHNKFQSSASKFNSPFKSEKREKRPKIRIGSNRAFLAALSASALIFVSVLTPLYLSLD